MGMAFTKTKSNDVLIGADVKNLKNLLSKSDLDKLYINMAMMETTIINNKSNLLNPEIRQTLEENKKFIDTFILEHQNLNWASLNLWNDKMNVNSEMYLFCIDNVLQRCLDDLDIYIYRNILKPIMRHKDRI